MWFKHGLYDSLVQELAQWAWNAFGWTWNEPGEWLLLQCNTPMGQSNGTKKRNFHLALFEKIQFLCFLKLKIHEILTKNHTITLTKGSICLKLCEKA